jgi:hypothetical protein
MTAAAASASSVSLFSSLPLLLIVMDFRVKNILNDITQKRTGHEHEITK